MRNIWEQSGVIRVITVALVVIVFFSIVTGAYAWYYRDRVVANTRLGVHDIGGLTRDEIADRIGETAEAFTSDGIRLSIDGKSELIDPMTIGFNLDVSQAVDIAFQRGHTGSFMTKYRERLTSLWKQTKIDAPVTFDDGALKAQIRDVAELMDAARRDVRLLVKGTDVQLATDTAVGRIIDQDETARLVSGRITLMDASEIRLELREDLPRADSQVAMRAVESARLMIARPIVLTYEDLRFSITRDQLAEWLVSEYEDNQLKAEIDEGDVSVFVTTIASAINIPPVPARITSEDGRVTGFTPPKIGRAVQEDKLIGMILAVIRSRTTEKPSGDIITVPLKPTTISLEGLDSGAGITELIGKATTPFTGSPRNRIANIKNGIKYLSGTIIPSGAEFSTIATLGVIDNTTGYLPELVIKGDRTVPEFGGGLCQVSTTLFRAVLDAGLPVTSRQSHSYRVSYYEKDGDGRVIGPGLDATIYAPNPDLKFLNDTPYPILIIGYVIGDKATFELYGTKDGRTSSIDGPYKLTESPPGEPKYVDEPTLPVGVTKQVETPHPGGTAVATYTITYKDGTVKTQEFRSRYRPWPAVFLVGTGGATPTPSVPALPIFTPATSASPLATPTP